MIASRVFWIKHIEEYINECSEQIKYVKKENGDAASARNVGIDVAEGEHIVFIDADDTVACDYLEKNIWGNKEK